MSLHVDTVLADLSVSGQEGRLLAFVSARDGVPVTAIVRLLGVPKSTVTSLLQRLERAELMRRGDNPGDARSWLVFTTAKGLRIGAAARARVLDLERRIQARISDADMRALSRIAAAVAQETAAR